MPPKKIFIYRSPRRKKKVTARLGRKLTTTQGVFGEGLGESQQRMFQREIGGGFNTRYKIS